jgi:hypothetical protein
VLIRSPGLQTAHTQTRNFAARCRQALMNRFRRLIGARQPEETTVHSTGELKRRQIVDWPRCAYEVRYSAPKEGFCETWAEESVSLVGTIRGDS